MARMYGYFMPAALNSYIRHAGVAASQLPASFEFATGSGIDVDHVRDRKLMGAVAINCQLEPRRNCKHLSVPYAMYTRLRYVSPMWYYTLYIIYNI